MGDSSRAAGRSWVTSGFVSLANFVRRASVVLDSCSKVGRARKVCSSSLLRAAVVAKTRLELSMSERSWPSRSLSAAKTSPVSRTTPCTLVCWALRIRSRLVVSSANGARLPRASEMSCPRPCEASASCCIQMRNDSRVFASKARKISSSSTVGETAPAGRLPFSGIVPALLEPGVSST